MTRTPWVAAALLALAALRPPRPRLPEAGAGRLPRRVRLGKRAAIRRRTPLRRMPGRRQGGLGGPHLYAEDAVLYPSGTPPLSGRALRSGTRSSGESVGMKRHWTVQATTRHVEASGPVAVETGSNVTTFTPREDRPARRMAARAT